MLTPMIVQYLVGLCCLRRNPDAVDITIGDMVDDAAAEKERDVDVTVTISEENEGKAAFKAFEVKREKEPLDVSTVEQLCAKLRDMPAVTHRAIVSASGFTSGAISKAAAHETKLYTMKKWDKPLSEQFPSFKDIGRPEEFFRGVSSKLLCWIGWRTILKTSSGPNEFQYPNENSLYDSKGSQHGKYRNLAAFIEEILYKSTQILFGLEPAVTLNRAYPLITYPDNKGLAVSPPWPHTHTLDVRAEGIFLMLNSQVTQLEAVTISGFLQWQQKNQIPEFYILEDESNQEAFAGTLIAPWGYPPDKMFTIIVSPDSRALGIHTIELSDKHKNAIRKLKLISKA